MVSDYKFMKLLKDKKVADAYQYFEASAYKLYLAELSYSALESVIAQYQENEKTYVEKVFEDALATGKGAYKAHANYNGPLVKTNPEKIIMNQIIPH